MNRVTIIGNLTRDPELRTTPSGATVCSFTVAVNRRARRDAQNGQPEADFFRVSAWNQQAEVCNRYLSKGRKVAVVGPVSARAYQGNDGQIHASLEVMANEVEFLSPRSESEADGGYAAPAAPAASAPAGNAVSGGFTAVETDELPF